MKTGENSHVETAPITHYRSGLRRPGRRRVWVGYQWASRLAKRHNVTLLTYHKRDKLPASRQLSGLRVIEWADPIILGRSERFNSLFKPGYVPFYFKARRWLNRALAKGEHFDLGHQPLPVAMRYPSPLAGFGIPYVIGPVGGSLEAPDGFRSKRDTAPWYEGLRKLDRLRMRVDPLLRQTYEEASCVIGIGSYVRGFLADRPLRRFEIMSETAIEELPPEVDRSSWGGPVRLLYVGRLVRTKGARDAIGAFDFLRDLSVRLDIVGDGFDRTACEKLTSELGLTDRVIFHGRTPRIEVDQFYRLADIFIFPSYREPGGNVIFEALGWGLPLVVTPIGGPGAVVDDTCGLRVVPHTPEQFARDLAVAIRRLVESRELRSTLGKGARQRAAEIGLWDAKLDRVDSIYEEVLSDQTN